MRTRRDLRGCLALSALCASLSGCQAGQGSPTPVEAWDSAGVTVVFNRDAQWGEGEAWRVSAEPRLSIGVLDGEEEYQFVRVSAAAFQPDGDLVVADAGSSTVRLYDELGVHKKTLGGPGSGPGEFRMPVQVLTYAAGSIFVWDDAAFRLTRFDADGELTTLLTLGLDAVSRAVEPPLYPGSALMLPGGELLVRLVEKAKVLPSAERYRQQSGVLRVAGDLMAVESVMRFGGAEQVMVEAPWGPFNVTPALARNTVIAVQPNRARLCIGRQEGPEVVCLESDGSRTAMRWVHEPIPVRRDEADVVAWREATRELLGQKVSPDDLRRLIDAVPVPETWPEYSRILLDHDGNLWVRRGPANDGAAVEFLVFEPEGALLGTVLMPPVRVLEIGADYVVGVYRDELEVEYVQVFEIDKPSSDVANP